MDELKSLPEFAKEFLAPKYKIQATILSGVLTHPFNVVDVEADKNVAWLTVDGGNVGGGVIDCINLVDPAFLSDARRLKEAYLKYNRGCEDINIFDPKHELVK